MEEQDFSSLRSDVQPSLPSLSDFRLSKSFVNAKCFVKKKKRMIYEVSSRCKWNAYSHTNEAANLPFHSEKIFLRSNERNSFNCAIFAGSLESLSEKLNYTRHKDSRNRVRCVVGVCMCNKSFSRLLFRQNASKCITKRSPLRYATILNHRIIGLPRGAGRGVMEKLNRNKHFEFTLRTLGAQ